MLVLSFSGRRWTFYSNHLQRAEFGKDEQQTGKRVGANAWMPAVGLPVVFDRNLGRLLLQLKGLGRVGVRGLVIAMQEGDRIGNARNERRAWRSDRL